MFGSRDRHSRPCISFVRTVPYFISLFPPLIISRSHPPGLSSFGAMSMLPPPPRCVMCGEAPAEEVPAWEGLWIHAGRPPMILEGSNMHRVRATGLYLSTFSHTEYHGLWRQPRSSVTESTMEIFFRYYSPSEILIKVCLTWNTDYDCWVWAVPVVGTDRHWIKAMLIPMVKNMKKFILAQAPPGWQTGTPIYQHGNHIQHIPSMVTISQHGNHIPSSPSSPLSIATATPPPTSPNSTTSQYWTILPGQMSTLLSSFECPTPID